jgi:hypothetical protein
MDVVSESQRDGSYRRVLPLQDFKKIMILSRGCHSVVGWSIICKTDAPMELGFINDNDLRCESVSTMIIW